MTPEQARKFLADKKYLLRTKKNFLTLVLHGLY